MVKRAAGALLLSLELEPDAEKSVGTQLYNVVSAFLQGVPGNLQAVLADFIEQGHFATHIRRMRRIYAERHQALQRAAETRLGGGLLDVVPTDSGLHTIGRLPLGLCERAVSRAAAERRITAAPIGRFAVSPIPTQGLVLGFSGTTPEEIVTGVEILGEVLEDLSPHLHGKETNCPESGQIGRIRVPGTCFGK